MPNHVRDVRCCCCCNALHHLSSIFFLSSLLHTKFEFFITMSNIWSVNVHSRTEWCGILEDLKPWKSLKFEFNSNFIKIPIKTRFVFIQSLFSFFAHRDDVGSVLIQWDTWNRWVMRIIRTHNAIEKKYKKLFKRWWDNARLNISRLNHVVLYYVIKQPTKISFSVISSSCIYAIHLMLRWSMFTTLIRSLLLTHDTCRSHTLHNLILSIYFSLPPTRYCSYDERWEATDEKSWILFM